MNIHRRKAITTISALTFLQIVPARLSAQAFPSVDQARKNAFPLADHFEQKRVIAVGDQFEKIQKRSNGTAKSRLFSYHEARQGQRLLGYVVERSTLGKHKMIDCMIALSPALTVEHIEILAYRESHGYQIRGERFREQFYGLGQDDTIEIGDPIQNIATATISCRSMVRLVNEVLAYASILFEPVASNQNKTAVPAALALMAAGLCTLRTPRERLARKVVPAMDTLLEVQAYGDEQAISAAIKEVHRIEEKLSIFREHSEMSLLNKSAGKGWMRLSKESYRLLARCVEYGRQSDAVFSVVRDKELRKSAPPQALQLRRGRRVRLVEGAQVDLGAVAKGYALDRAAKVLRRHGVRSGLLNFGGQLLAMNAPHGKEGWQVQVGETSLLLCNESISVSGTSERGDHIWGVNRAKSGNCIERAKNAELADVASTRSYVIANRYA